ncbi:hypothetical protein [Candidatus Endomicrobiellum agilis]|uniref:hypothetical protein n=1 Tax=Candidatus Endomicrobiellum agilis TaxID=3238957 RepID=UPI00358424A8|nr:hypothetical protein [Endomicrobium sp.]
MKKIICICICICICLMSDCGKLPNHGSTVNTVVENDEGREDVLTPTQTSKTALEPSKSPAPTSSPRETAPVLPDSAAPSSLIFKEEVE